jgi:hypothetical protein
MELGQAFSMHHVGAITGATVIERPAANGSVWVVEFQLGAPLPSYLSNLLEVARGGPKIFKTVQAALNDVKSTGVTNATVQFTVSDFFRANRFQWMYEWIQGLPQQGFDEDLILQAFATNKSINLDLNDPAAVKLGRIIIRHALGKSDGKELTAYLPPVEVLDVKYLKPTDEGYLCQAFCADSKEDFIFLVSLDVSEKTLKYVLTDQKAALCKFVLIAAHQRHPQMYTDPDQPAPTINGVWHPPSAAFRLTLNDIDCVRALPLGAADLVNKHSS